MAFEPTEPSEVPTVFSSGYLIFRNPAQLQFLLMRHQDRWDLPKGHLDPEETKAQAAVRELQEETGIEPADITTVPDFAFAHQYQVNSRRDPSRVALKELTIYLGFLSSDRAIECTEHASYQWWDWSPPHRIQPQTIDPLLACVEKYLQASPTTRKLFGLDSLD